MPRQVAWLVIPMLGLATPLAIYSLLFFEHTLAAMLVTLSLLMFLSIAAFRNGAASVAKPPLWMAALSGVLLAVAIYFRSELYVLAAVMGGAYLFLAWKCQVKQAVIVWIGAFVLGLVPLWAFYAVTEGTLLPLHALWYFAGSGESQGNGPALGGIPPLRYIASAGWRVVPDFFFGPQNAALSPVLPLWAILLGLLGLGLCLIAALLRLVRREAKLMIWRLSLLITGLSLILTSSAPALLATQPYYNLHGFLLASPFVALAISPSTNPRRNIRPAPEIWLGAITLLYVGLHVFIISAFSGLGPISRHEWGQRYLLPAYPLLAVLSLLAAWRIWESTRNTLAEKRLVVACIAVWAMLGLVGLGFSIRGYAALHDERTQVAAWMELARSLPPEEPLVTDVWWLPLNLAADFYTRPIMLAQGDARLSEWATKMRQQGVGSFGFMSNNPTILTSGWGGSITDLTADGAPRQARGMWLQRYTMSDTTGSP